jgi:hypothetical protein
MSRFNRTDSELMRSVLWAQDRSERLAGRIVRAREVLRARRNVEQALAILDGSEDTATEPVLRPELARTIETPVADGLLDFGDWSA